MGNKSSKPQKITIDTNKMLVQENLRMNLLLVSLYLSAFELLKLAIIDGTKQFFIFQDEVTEEDVEELKKTFEDNLANRFRESYLEEVSRYEEEIGVRLEDRDKYGLLPSCKWLQKMGVLSEEEVESVRAIRDHRNEVAHEMPTLLISTNLDVNLEHFQKIRGLLHKIDVFWARNDLLLNPATLEEIDIYDIPDNEIMSGRVAILELITNTVAEYLNEISRSETGDG